MTGSQYNNVVQWTLANTPAGTMEDSFEAARAVFNNMGIAFPHGDSLQIVLTLLNGEYMGWAPCTYAQAQELANAGTAVMGIDTDHVVVVLPDESVNGRISPAAAAESVYARTAADIPKDERVAMQFYAYYANTPTPTQPVTPNPEPKPDVNTLVSWARGALEKNYSSAASILVFLILIFNGVPGLSGSAAPKRTWILEHLIAPQS